MPARNDRGQFVRDDGFHINIPHPFTILKYVIFYIVLFPWFRMLKRSNHSVLFTTKCDSLRLPMPY